MYKVSKMEEEKKEVYGVIYKATNIQNHKVYIGLTTKYFESYKNDHLRDARNNKDVERKYFYNAIRKYGEHNFKWEILGECYSQEELNEAEIECIVFFRSYGMNIKKFDHIYGYNMTTGGKGVKRGTLSEKECQEISERGRKRYEDPLEREKQSIISKAMWQTPGHWDLISSKRIKLLSERPDLREALIHAGPDHYLYKEINLEEIRAMYESGLSGPKIAEQLGVSAALIHSRLRLAGVIDMKEIGNERKKAIIDKEEILQLRSEGLHGEEIANKLGVCNGVLFKRCKEWGIKFDLLGKNNPRYRELDIAEVLKLKDEGLSQTEIADILGVSRVTVRMRLRELNLKFDPRPLGRTFCKRPDLDINYIVGLREKGFLIKDIAKELNVSETTISKRLKNREKYE